MSRLPHLLRLLDDDTPAVRQSVAQALDEFGGDLSEQLPDLRIDLSDHERGLLSAMLHPGRRARLVAEWVVPSAGWAALGDDWDRVEGLLRVLSDFLHDGITLRLPLPDALDMLVEDYQAAGGPPCSDALRQWLFGSRRLRGNESDFHAPENSDLAWTISEGRSNPIGLSLVYLLAARRIGVEVEGCPFPGRFLCRIHVDGRARIVDCYDRGRCHDLYRLLQRSDLAPAARRALTATAPAGATLVRVLRNLHRAFTGRARTADAALIGRLLDSLHARP